MSTRWWGRDGETTEGSRLGPLLETGGLAQIFGVTLEVAGLAARLVLHPIGEPVGDRVGLLFAAGVEARRLLV
jgi:hypothetical protein